MIRITDGKRAAYTATTRDRALQIFERLSQASAVPPPRTIAVALSEYDTHLRVDRRHAPASCEHARRTLAAFLGDGDASLGSLTAEKARRLARFEHTSAHRIRRRYALSTRYAVLGHAFRFFEWAKSRHYVEANPFDGVRPTGLAAAGPAPFGLDQARTLAAVALHQAHQDAGALGAILALVLGLRSAEVLPLRVQDFDPDAQRLHLLGSRRGPRTVPIPELLRPCVRAMLVGKPPEALLLGTGRTGRPRAHNFLWRAIQRLCRQAHVAPVCPRSLRALHRKLAQSAAKASKAITKADRTPAAPSVDRAPGATPGSSAEWVRVVDLLGLSPSMTVPRWDALLSVLTPAQVAQLHFALRLKAAA